MIQPKYYSGWYFSEGLAAVSANGKFGFINRQGETVIPFRFDDASPFHGALARVILQGKAGYVDKRGRMVWQGEDDNAVPRP